MNNKTKTRSLRVAIIAIALLLCFALAVGVTSALYQARRQATGTLNMDKGIVIDYKGFNKGDENIWQRETTTSFKLFEETNAQPGQEISVYPSGIRANVDSINFYARLKLDYIFYNVGKSIDESGKEIVTKTKVDFKNPKSLIKTSNDFFTSNWIPSADGYYYFGENTTLNQFSKDNQNFENIFADGAKFIIEGESFVGEGGGFVVGDNSINRIEVFLTLETLQGDATAEQAKALGWEIKEVDRYPFTFSLNNAKQTATITGAIDDPIELDIPNKLLINNQEYDTISIGEGAFKDCLSLRNVKIPNSVTNFGNEAFKNCLSLKSIEIPDSVKSIGNEAFKNCWNLSSIEMPEGVDSIGDEIFSNCKNLESISIPESITSIGKMAFEGCDSLNSRKTEKNGIEYLGNEKNEYVVAWRAGRYDEGDAIKVNENCKITYQCFGEIWNNCKIELPEGLISIGYATFSNSQLTKITIPNNVKNIGDQAFFSCYNLTSIDIPDSVNSIGNSAFQYCNNLQSVKIGNGVTSIGDYTFNGCRILETVIIPNSITSIGKCAFCDCEKLTSITSLEGVTSIGNSAFEGCKSLTSITIPEGVTSIGDRAFYNCYALAEVYNLSELNIIAGKDDYGNVGYYAKVVHISTDASKRIEEDKENGIAYYVEKEGSSIIKKIALVLRDKTKTSVKIAEDCTEINQYAFADCTNLTSIEIPKGVTSIGESAFSRCSGLELIKIPNTVTSIEKNAFYDCNNLATSIGDIGGNWVKDEDGSTVDASTLLKDIEYDIKRA